MLNRIKRGRWQNFMKPQPKKTSFQEIEDIILISLIKLIPQKSIAFVSTKWHAVYSKIYNRLDPQIRHSRQIITTYRLCTETEYPLWQRLKRLANYHYQLTVNGFMDMKGVLSKKDVNEYLKGEIDTAFRLEQYGKMVTYAKQLEQIDVIRDACNPPDPSDCTLQPTGNTPCTFSHLGHSKKAYDYHLELFGISGSRCAIRFEAGIVYACYIVDMEFVEELEHIIENQLFHILWLRRDMLFLIDLKIYMELYGYEDISTKQGRKEFMEWVNEEKEFELKVANVMEV